ncbi:MAG TPA: intein-containing Rv2578c family radical SAM protein [Arthrobacter sp.]|nr:intein-containing Rv2578c family radical SAM protein [Arthrobacter sp.]
MRWDGQLVTAESPAALPGLAKLSNLVRSVQTPEFAGITFHEVLAKSALSRVPSQSAMPFAWTINPYRGCSHACTYCLHPDTLILMADGRQKALRKIMVGDQVMGTEVRGSYRRYTRTQVEAKWPTRKHAYRLTLGDGTQIVASGDHRFLSDRGWKFVQGAMCGAEQRPYLTTNNKLMGFGLSGLAHEAYGPEQGEGYRRGYLTGMIRGDAMLLRRTYTRASGTPNNVSMFRLALADSEALERTRGYLAKEGISTTQRPFGTETDTRKQMTAIHTSRAAHYDAIKGLIEWPVEPSDQWNAGYLAGVFDAEGSCSRGVLRISNSNQEILTHIEAAMSALGITHVREPARMNGVAQIRVVGGLPMRSRFFGATDPAISRKLNIEGLAVKSDADLRIVLIEDLGKEQEMFDITTGTGDFIANGVVSHNCFARNTHSYLGLDTGLDFDSQLVVKVNAGEVLRRELAKPSWKHEQVAMGTNTDPYQRAEGRYKLMPEIIRALADSGTPFSILTKGTLLARDLPLLREAAKDVDVGMGISLAMTDAGLAHRVEPGTPTPRARLDLIAKLSDAGLACSVMAMPILPWLTDSEEALDDLCASVAAAGATSMTAGALHLRPGAREWYMQWLAKEYPQLVGSYRRLYDGGTYASKDYRRWLAARVGAAKRRHGLQSGARLRDVNPPKADAAPGRPNGRAKAAAPPEAGQATLF